ncbi:ABC transporter ATP-binding protein [candidate division KSB1 bacterium]|nr:ABC transporter ATP-binding protein [candidate division KSB1 bacterium]
MKNYLRLLRYVKPYWTWLVTSIICMILFAIFSSFSIWMIAPFVGTLFSSDSGAHESVLNDIPSTGLSIGGSQTATDTSATAQINNANADSKAAHMSKQIDGLKKIKVVLKQKMDEYLLGGSKMDALKRICIVFFFLFLAKNIFHYAQAYTMAYVERRVMKDIRDQLFEQFNRLPLSYFHKRRAGQLISRVTNDVEVVNKGINVSFTNLSRDPVLIIMYLGMAIIISWKLTLIAFTVLPLSMAVIIHIGKKLRTFSTRQQQKMAVLTSILQETVTGIRVVKAFAMEPFEVKKFKQESEHWFREVFNIARVQKLSSPLSEQLSVLVGMFILWYGGSQVLSGEILGAEMFLIFLACIFSMIQPIKALSDVNNSIQEGLAAAERIFRVLDTPPEVSNQENAVELTKIEQGIEYDHVWFAYNENEFVVSDVSFEIKPGEVVALVGPSGGGKSTLADLMPRFYELQKGSIRIDGVDIQDVQLKSLRQLMGIVTQEIILFNDTVRNNIAYGTADISDDQVIAAAKAANAHEFIEQMPEKYDTMIGDRGLKLSGGQRQRISIARAILKNPPILIFDEATSALDTESELQVQEAIENLMKNRTTLVIAHRLSTVQHADRILVIKDGRIVQQGTHDELLKQEGVYQTLYHLQFRNG